MVKLWAEILSGNRIFLFYDRGILWYSYYYYCFIIEEYPSNTEMKFQPTFFVCANIRIKLTFYFCHHHHRDHLLVFASYWHSGDFGLTSFILTIEDFFFLRWVAVWFPLAFFEKCDQGNLNISFSWTKLEMKLELIPGSRPLTSLFLEHFISKSCCHFFSYQFYNSGLFPQSPRSHFFLSFS